MNHKTTRIYSSRVFDEETMKRILPCDVYKQIKNIRVHGGKLSLDVADVFAKELKNWAIENGASHFTHWFSPLNGATSEKHNSFLVPKGSGGEAIFKFSGKDLIKGESDASSFPNGGLRVISEARGYTAWDISSNAFIKDKCLYIPTAFCSYTGHALDKKTPLLRSIDSLRKEMLKFLKIFDLEPNDISINIGAEQEFFLLPNKYVDVREDLIMSDRTLFGDSPSKGQEMEDHYFGSMHPKIKSVLDEVEDEAWKLGIAIHTKHNEVAPCQFELAPIFNKANRAVDENLVLMDLLDNISQKHGLTCIFHEKPFKGINGSGKHCNWSINADNTNLLDPGANPSTNNLFMAFISCVIRSLDKYYELVRMTASSSSNDCRLGGHEAPPSIFSCFLGEEIYDCIKAYCDKKHSSQTLKDDVNLGTEYVPKIKKDISDRNRTSPFAFTGNKFEFRMPGSSDNLSDCITVLNTIVCDSLYKFVEDYNNSKEENSIYKITCKNFKNHSRIIFNGNGYKQSWIDESKRRGINNILNTPQALDFWTGKKTIDLFEHFHVLYKEELDSRRVVYTDNYNKAINIEFNVMTRMTTRLFIPAINKYMSDIASNLANLNASNVEVNTDNLKNLLKDLSAKVDEIFKNLETLKKLKAESHPLDRYEKSAFNANKLIPAMNDLRNSVDGAEKLTARNYWPVPSYNRMLFCIPD